MTELSGFERWLGNLPNTQKYEFVDFLNLVKEASEKKLALGIQVNVNARGEVAFDGGKASMGTMKKLILS